MKKNLAFIAGLLSLLSPLNAQSNYNFGDKTVYFSNGDPTIEKYLVSLVNNRKMTLISDKKEYSFYAKDFISFFTNKENITKIMGKDYDNFANLRPVIHGNCTASYIDSKGEEIRLGVNGSAIGFNKRIFESPLFKILNGVPINYNFYFKGFDSSAQEKFENLDNTTNNPAYEVIIAMGDLLCNDQIREEKNKGASCTFFMDVYELLFLNSLVEKGIPLFLNNLDNSSKSK
jgi:hypothetical protein